MKKGDTAYIISSEETGSLILECKIIKITTEDKIVDWNSSKTSRIPKYVVSKQEGFSNIDFTGKYNGRYPEKMARVAYLENEEKKVKWIELDSVQRSPLDFLNFITMPYQFK